MPGDQILQINGEDVKRAPRDHVIQLVRNCREAVSLIVCQPPLDNVSLYIKMLNKYNSNIAQHIANQIKSIPVEQFKSYTYLITLIICNK